MTIPNELTAIERDDDWFIAFSPEIPGALAAAITLILEDRREDGRVVRPAQRAERFQPRAEAGGRCPGKTTPPRPTA